MSFRGTTATSLRIFRQLRRDPRTIALMLLVPVVMLVILRFVFADAREIYDATAALILGIMTFVVMFVVASVATLRERMNGTLERLLISPIAKADIIGGYALTFGAMSLLQSAVVTFVLFGVFDLTIAGSIAVLLLIAVLSGLVGMSIGLLMSEFAKNEFQVVQFMPAFVLPQFLLAGVFIPRDQMARGLEILSSVMPLTYIVEAMQEVMQFATWTAELSRALVILAAFALVALFLASVTMRRK